MPNIWVIYLGVLVFAVFVFNLNKISSWFRLRFTSKKGSTKNLVMICPNCGETNISMDLTKEMIVWKGITRYKCNNCDFSAPSFLMVPKSKVNGYRKRILNKSEETKEWLRTMSSSKGMIPKISIQKVKEKRNARK